MHNKILINIGFYILLLFAFMIPIHAIAAYVLAALIFLVWFVDALIFKELGMSDKQLYYPLISFDIFLILGWIVAALYGREFPLVYVGFLALIYFIVPGFITTVEQRRMVIWTFLAGTMLMVGLHLIEWWRSTSTSANINLHITQPLLTFISMAFAILIALYAESRDYKEKLFLALVTLPLAMIMFLSGDKAILVAMLAIVFIAAVIRDRMLLIPFLFLILIMFTEAFEVKYYLQKSMGSGDMELFIRQLPDTFDKNLNKILDVEFYGDAAADQPLADSTGTFFLDFLLKAGPPAILFLFWILLERAREAFFKNRRLSAEESHPYHLAVFLTICALIVLNFYDQPFLYPQIILASWMLWGMSEI
jgi:hypothetical protein